MRSRLLQRWDGTARQALVALAGLVLLASSAGAAIARTHTVIIEGMRFRPAVLVIARGDRVTWINRDLVPHTATAKSGAFNSGNIAPGASWTFIARKAGTFAYFCSYHPTMKGRITIR